MGIVTGKMLSVEQAPGFTHKERKKLAVIWRRIQFLDDRIANHHGDPSRDKQEVAALRWLLARAEAPVPPKEET